MIKNIVSFIISFFILIIALLFGKLTAWLLPIGIPESIWGLLILFAALTLGLVKPQWLLPSARGLTRYMPLFFLPICVGIIDYTDILAQFFAPIVLANVLSSILSLLVIGWIAQWLFTANLSTNRKK